ncbi:hypothetical protein J1614_006659 [Plenodomus biglobosus]|nr:hypothetical protein J1614_006659 [Plenodomus biglobosus]
MAQRDRYNSQSVNTEVHCMDPIFARLAIGSGLAGSTVDTNSQQQGKLANGAHYEEGASMRQSMQHFARGELTTARG